MVIKYIIAEEARFLFKCVEKNNAIFNINFFQGTAGKNVFTT